MAEQIKMLFGVNILGGPRELCYMAVLILSQTRGGGPTLKFWDPCHISGMAKARDLKFYVYIRGGRSYPKLCKVGYLGVLGGVT